MPEILAISGISVKHLVSSFTNRARIPSVKEEDRRALGYLVRVAREKKGWNQAELGKRIGTSRAPIGALENGGIYHPKLTMLEGIAMLLEIPVSAFLTEAGISLPESGSGQLQFLASQLTPRNLKLLISIGHELLQDQHDQPQTGSSLA